MPLHDLLDYGQANPGAGMGALGMKALEHQEDAVEVLNPDKGFSWYLGQKAGQV